MRVLTTPQKLTDAHNAYTAARAHARATGSKGSAYIIERDGEQTRAHWHRRDETSPHKHAALD